MPPGLWRKTKRKARSSKSQSVGMPDDTPCQHCQSGHQCVALPPNTLSPPLSSPSLSNVPPPQLWSCSQPLEGEVCMYCQNYHQRAPLPRDSSKECVYRKTATKDYIIPFYKGQTHIIIIIIVVIFIVITEYCPKPTTPPCCSIFLPQGCYLINDVVFMQSN